MYLLPNPTHFYILSFILDFATQSVVLESAAAASPRSLLAMPTLRTHPSHTKPESAFS